MVGPTREDAEKMKVAILTRHTGMCINPTYGRGYKACCQVVDKWVSMPPQKKFSFKGLMFRYLNQELVLSETEYGYAVACLKIFLPEYFGLSSVEMGRVTAIL